MKKQAKGELEKVQQDLHQSISTTLTRLNNMVEESKTNLDQVSTQIEETVRALSQEVNNKLRVIKQMQIQVGKGQ